jgi:hypothetical protein
LPTTSDMLQISVYDHCFFNEVGLVWVICHAIQLPIRLFGYI